MEDSGSIAELRVLAVVADARQLAAIERAREPVDVVVNARRVSEALELVRKEKFDLAIVDVTLESGAAMALIHHIPAVAARMPVVVLVPPIEMSKAAEALVLGAASVLVDPPTGESLSRTFGEVRTRLGQAREVARLSQEITTLRTVEALTRRVMRLATGSGASEAVQAVTEAIARVARASGVSLYATFASQSGECLRLSSIGTAEAYPASCSAPELAKLASTRRARLVSLPATRGELGYAIVEGAEDTTDEALTRVAELAGAVLSIVDTERLVRPGEPLFEDKSRKWYSRATFEDFAIRELKRAARHQRRVSVGVLSVDRRSVRVEELDTVLATAVRETDMIADLGDGRLALLLFECGALEAHAVRRRVLARLHGERRGGRASRGEAKGAPIAKPRATFGIATFPHDGQDMTRLLRVASARSDADPQSLVFTLGLTDLSFAEIVAALLKSPFIDAGVRSPYPLDLSTSSLASLLRVAVGEGARGGSAILSVSLGPRGEIAKLVRAEAARIGTKFGVDVYDFRQSASGEECAVLLAEHGTWLVCGRYEGERFRGMHTADPLLADLLLERLASQGRAEAG